MSLQWKEKTRSILQSFINGKMENCQGIKLSNCSSEIRDACKQNPSGNDWHMRGKRTLSSIICSNIKHSLLLLLFCPSSSCTIIYCIKRFTSLCKNLFNLLEVLAEAFRCHVHQDRQPLKMMHIASKSFC